MDGLDLDAPVHDRLLLVSVPGAVDHLAAELEQAAAGGAFSYDVVRRFGDAILVDHRGPLRPLAEVRPWSGCAVWLADRVPGPEALDSLDVGALTAASRGSGALAALGPGAGLPFRVAPDLGEARWLLRDALVADLGWVNEPSDWRLNLRTLHGALVAEVGPLFQTSRFGEMVRMPASTTPVVSSVLVRLLKAEPGDLVLDPFCGAGTNLVVAVAMAPGSRLVGLDRDPHALAAARDNLAACTAPWLLARSDAARLPLADGAVDRVVANLPFGKRVGSHAGNQDLYPVFLREVARVLAPRGRAVLLTEDKRLLLDAVQRTTGLKIVKETVLETGGLHPSAYVVTRGRASGRRRS